MARKKEAQGARVLLVGKPRDVSPLAASLTRGGYEIDRAQGAGALMAAARLAPDAIVVAARAEPALAMAVRSLRTDARTRHVPLLLEGPESVLQSAPFRGLQVDEQLPHDRVTQELERRLSAMVRAKRLVDREERSRARLEALLEIGHAAASTLEPDEILRIVVKRLAQVVQSDRCAILLAEQSGEVMVAATVEAPELSHHLRLDLSRYPELALALQSQREVLIDDARTDPRMAPVRALIEPLDVRSILVQPLISGGELQGALFLRQLGEGTAFDDEDRAFARGVAATLADHLRNARAHKSLHQKKDELEAAYVERYRELAAANRRLKELNQFKDELLALVSHDIRAPLNVLLGHGQLLQEMEDLAPQDRASIDAVVRQGRKILELVEGLLEKGRGEADHLALELAEVDLAHHAVEAARELEILARQRGVTLRVEAPGELWAMADRLKVRQVLQNLIQNAIRHAGSQVSVHAERVRGGGADRARLSVLDDGPGVPEALLPVIFDRYQRGAGSGTGLGLSICREFVELHGGEIWAEPGPKGGARFLFELPLTEGDQLVPAREKPRVLLVEDEPSVAQQGVEILRTQYRVEVARDGAEGIAKARQLRPALILIDVFLPRVDGLDAVAAIRKSPGLGQVPIILIASRPGVAHKVSALELHLSGQVKKPFAPKLLLDAVQGALAASAAPVARQGIDPATGFLDAAALRQHADREETRARRYGRPLAVAMVVAPVREDTPARLADLARLLRAAARTTDVLGHLGGGAFAVILPECTEPVAEALAERMAAVLHAVVGHARAEAASVQLDAGETGRCAAVVARLAKKLAPAKGRP